MTCVVIHCTATDGLESPKRWLCNPEARASAHYLVAKDGSVYHLVDDDDVAWHAGISEWKKIQWVNNFSIGIELVHPNTPGTPYPPEQIKALEWLCADLCRERRVAPEDVVGHADISPGRKTDPVDFPWDDFRKRLKSRLEGTPGGY